MSLLELITKASTDNSSHIDEKYTITLNSDQVLYQLNPQNDDVAMVKQGVDWKISPTDTEIIELGQNFVKKLQKKMKNTHKFDKDTFFDLFASYLAEISEKLEVSGLSQFDESNEGRIVKFVEKLGSFVSRGVKVLVIECCVVLECWKVLESLIVNGFVEHSCLSNLMSNLIEKNRVWLVVLCLKFVSDMQCDDVARVLRYFLSESDDVDGGLSNVRKEWEGYAMSAMEKAMDRSLGDVRMSMARDASLLLTLAYDSFSVYEMCLHYLVGSRNVDEVVLGSCIGRLDGEEVMVLLRYLAKWLNKYSRFPQACPCPKASVELGLKACEWVPSLEDVVKCVGLVVDEHFSSLVLHKEFHEELKCLDGVVEDLTAEAKVCGIVSNLTEALKGK